MSLSDTRRKAAEAAIFAFIKAKGSRAPSAVALNPGTNPDLRDDLVDLIADVLIWAKAEGLDPAYIARVGASHTGAAEQVDDAMNTALADPDAHQIHTLAEAIRERSSAVCVFSPEDVFERYDGASADAVAWLERHTDRIEEAMSEAGNRIIDSMLDDDGKLVDE